jgi:signal transduction histidine kinase
MDTTSTQFQNRLATLEQENALLQSRLQTCEQAYGMLRLSINNSSEHRLLEATAKATNALLTIAPFDRAVNTALQILGESLETDRLNVIETIDPLSDSAFPGWRALGYEWNSPGTVPQYAHGKAGQGSYEEVQWLYELFQQGQTASYLIEEVPEPFRSSQMVIGVKSTHLVPIFVQEQWWGVLGLDDCREAKQRSAAEMAALRIAANCIGSAIQRERLRRATQRTQQALLRAERERAAELAKSNAALKQTVDVLATETDLDRFLGHVLQVIATQLNAPLTEYWYHPEPDNIAYIGLTCWRGRILKPEEQPGHPGLVGYPVPPEMIQQENLHQRRSHFITDDIATSAVHIRIAHESGLDAGAWYRLYGVSRLLNVPLILGDKTIGALIVFLPKSRHFTEQQIELTYALAQQVTLAIQLTRLAEEAKQAAIAREQEKAAQERAAELAKANEALKRGVERLTASGTLESVLDSFLLESVAVANAAAGAVSQRGEGHEFIMKSLVEHEVTIYPFGSHAPDEVYRRRTAADTSGIMRRTAEGETFMFSVGDIQTWFPEAAAYHNEREHKVIWHFPFQVGGEVAGYLGLAFKEERSLSTVQQETVQALAYQVSLVLETLRLAEEAKQAAILNERNRIASEIHDTLAQAFTGISLQLEVAKELIHQEPQTVQQILNHISQLAETGLTEARRSVWALYPPAAEYADLAQLLYESVEQMTRNTNTTIEVNLRGNPCPLPPFIGMNLLRVGQEALTNALKHAQAEKITIELAYEPDRILLTIRDNGRGFVPPTTIDALNGGFGLVGMYERCDRINAQLNLTSQLGQGTQILIEAPLS